MPRESVSLSIFEDVADSDTVTLTSSPASFVQFFFFIIFQNDVEGGVRLRAVGEVKLLTFIHPESTHCHGDCELYVF